MSENPFEKNNVTSLQKVREIREQEHREKRLEAIKLVEDILREFHKDQEIDQRITDLEEALAAYRIKYPKSRQG